MIDDPQKMDRLMIMLKLSLPIQAHITRLSEMYWQNNHRILQFPGNVMLLTWCIVGTREALSAAWTSAALMQR